MATLEDFKSRIGKTVQIRALKNASNRTKARIKERGGSDGSFKVLGVTTAFRGVSPTLTGKPAVHFVSLDEKWGGWLPLEEIELVP